MELSSSLLQGLFLIMLTIFGGEVGNTFSCQTMKYLRSNVVIKHIVIICLIYFTVDFTDTKNSHPLDTMKTAFMTWVFYIVLSRQTLNFTIANFTLLGITYVLFNYSDYVKDEIKKHKSKDKEALLKEIDTYKGYSVKLLFVVSLIGLVVYFKKELKEHSKGFKMMKFLLGTKKCSSDSRF